MKRVLLIRLQLLFNMVPVPVTHQNECIYNKHVIWNTALIALLSEFLLYNYSRTSEQSELRISQHCGYIMDFIVLGISFFLGTLPLLILFSVFLAVGFGDVLLHDSVLPHQQIWTWLQINCHVTVFEQCRTVRRLSEEQTRVDEKAWLPFTLLYFSNFIITFCDTCVGYYSDIWYGNVYWYTA